MKGLLTRRARATRLLLSAALALVAFTTLAAPAHAQTGGDMTLYVEQSGKDGKEVQTADDQQRTTTSSKGSLAQTGDPGAKGVAALALVGGGLTAIGSAAKRRRGKLVPVSSDAADARTEHIS